MIDYVEEDDIDFDDDEVSSLSVDNMEGLSDNYDDDVINKMVDEDPNNVSDNSQSEAENQIDKRDNFNVDKNLKQKTQLIKQLGQTNDLKRLKSRPKESAADKQFKSGMSSLLQKKYSQNPQKVPYLAHTKLIPKVRFLYRPGIGLPDLSQYVNNCIEIIVASEYLTIFNPEYIVSNIWGNETYTSNSDIVCIIQHSNRYTLTDIPPFTLGEALSITCKVTKPRKTHASQFQNGIKSKAWKGYSGFNIKPEGKAHWLEDIGDIPDILMAASCMPSFNPYKRMKCQPIDSKLIQKLPENHMIFNMCNELSYKYSLSNICDQSADYKLWMSSQLKSRTLYVDSKNERFEFACLASETKQIQQHQNSSNNKNQNSNEDMDIFADEDEEGELYTVKQVTDPLERDNAFFAEQTVPLKDEFTITLFTGLKWSKIFWGNAQIHIWDQDKQVHFIISGIQNFKLYPNKLKQNHNVSSSIQASNSKAASGKKN